MKRLLAAVIATAILVTPATAVAETVPKADFTALFNLKPAVLAPLQTSAPLPLVVKAEPEPVEPAEPAVYTVVSGDNLTKIGTLHNVTWQRLWAKNLELEHPDTIYVGDKLTIPLADEVLERAIPAAVSLPAVTPGVAVPTQSTIVAPAPSASYDGGNTYGYGYCTWYVKNKRGSSLPNGLGNANTWYSRARSAGMAVGTTPVAGAVGTTTRGSLGHVVYVDSVNADGTINISEMNYKGWNVVSSRTTNASEFVYIY